MRRPLFLFATSLALAFAAAGCKSEKLVVGCKTDAQCEAHHRCAHGSCVCADDQACPAGQVCSSRTGSCRTDVGCVDDGDCPQGQICDSSTHNCIESGQCTSDLQCPLGQICDAYGPGASYACIAGCRDATDCPQKPGHSACADSTGQICTCNSTDRSQCPQAADGGAIGACACQTDICASTADCPYGYWCRVGSDDKPHCVFATSAAQPYCEGCGYGPADPSCGGGQNFCLVEPAYPGAPLYCGVDCSQGQECPSGYACQFVRLLTHGLCTTDAECPSTSAVPCASDADCPGSKCNLTTMTCGSFCKIDEGEQTGYCVCVVDKDCPADSCDSSTRRCGLTHQPCDPNDPAACQNDVFCRNVNGLNACTLGQNCKPLDGLTCDDLPRGP